MERYEWNGDIWSLLQELENEERRQQVMKERGTFSNLSPSERFYWLISPSLKQENTNKEVA